MKEIGEKIKEVRNKKGLTQEELAESSKVNLRTIQRIENNESKPRGKTLDSICSVLELDIIEIENQSNKKYRLFSIILTTLVIIGSFLGWFTFTSDEVDWFNSIHEEFKTFNSIAKKFIEKIGLMTITTTGWNGTFTILGIIPIKHWFISLCSLSIGGVTICNAHDIVKKKLMYIIVQLFVITIYSINVIISGMTSKNLNFEIGFFLVLISTIGLTFLYLDKTTLKK